MTGLEDKKGQFQHAVETEIKIEKNVDVRDINSKWNQIRGHHNRSQRSIRLSKSKEC
jgi:hypothetical protein